MVYNTNFAATDTPFKLSIIIPAYNEQETINELLQRVKESFAGTDAEIIVVDDGSTDQTRTILNQHKDNCILVFQPKNMGKGSAIRAGIEKVTGTHVVIQDADLEYDPNDLVMMKDEMLKNNLSVLYGSRSMHRGRNKEAGWSFYWGGQVLTVITNVLYGQKLSDEPTCYKMFKADLLKSLPLKCTGFEFCPEVTALVAKKGYKITEVPISYYPRDISEGKKIRWRDGVEAIYTLVKYRIW